MIAFDDTAEQVFANNQQATENSRFLVRQSLWKIKIVQ